MLAAARKLHPRATLMFFLLVATSVSASALDALGTLREFCRADGLGARLHPRTLPLVSGLVEWEVEPAWDCVFLIAGYEIAGVRQDEGAAVGEVRYSLSSEVCAGEMARTQRLEIRPFRLLRDKTSGIWRLAGPPPAPHVFQTEVDAEELAASLDARREGPYLSNSSFVWRKLHERGWNLPYLHTRDIVESSLFSVVEAPSPGDIVLYLDGETPYHIGIAEGSDVVSATLGVGVVRLPIEAFPGEARFMRPLADEQSNGAMTAPQVDSEPQQPTTQPLPSALEQPSEHSSSLRDRPHPRIGRPRSQASPRPPSGRARTGPRPRSK